MTAPELVNKFNLLPHPEGGWYRETYRSNETIAQQHLPERFNGSKVFSTAIYFLLDAGNFSAFHRIKSDECWHFYAGGALEIYVLQPNGDMVITQLGSNIANGEMFQYVVPANCWFASRPAPGSSFCFVGCTVAPGFDFDDFEMADAGRLSAGFPQHTALINQLCR